MKKTIAILIILFAAVLTAGFVRPMVSPMAAPLPMGNDVLVLETPAPTAKPTNPPPHFNDPIEWPDNLDEMFTFIQDGKDGYTFEPCKNLQAPFVSWAMVLAIKNAAQDDGGAGELWIDGATLKTILSRGGVAYDGRDLRVSENRLFGALLSSAFTGGVGVCGQADGKPIIFGAGVQRMIDTLAPAVGGRA